MGVIRSTPGNNNAYRARTCVNAFNLALLPTVAMQ